MQLDQTIDVPLPPYEPPPPWIPPQHRIGNPNYDNDIRLYLPRKLYLRRRQITDTLGFNVRGGEDNIPGMFITNVSSNSEADRLGVREGDQILEVNGVSFENIDHNEAVKVLKGSLDVNMILRYFPYLCRKATAKRQVLTSNNIPAANNTMGLRN